MLQVRQAGIEDVPLILAFIRELAEYERLSDAVMADEAALAATLFGDKPFAEVWLARWNGEDAGFALFFHNYSTFLAKPGIYLEDLFVRPAFRGRGIGKSLLTQLAQLAVARGCGRLEWSVLNWNTPAIGFYQALGAQAQAEWGVYRLSGDALCELARS